MVGKTPLACAMLLAAVAGCGPKVVRETVHQATDLEVQLRRTLVDGEPLARGFEQPLSIAPVRVVHILASLSYEDREGARRSVIRSKHVYELAEGLGEAFAKAGPDDEIVAFAISRDRRLGIFTVDRVTAFRAFAQQGQLLLEFYAIEENFKEDPRRDTPYEVPLDLPTWKPTFHLLAGTGQAVSGARGLAVDWRDPVYRKPVSLSRRGRMQRRTVLMEAPEEEEVDPSALPIPPEVTDVQIRALDQLDAVRRSGLLTEAEFKRRRRLVLEGRLEDAGYGTGAP